MTQMTLQTAEKSGAEILREVLHGEEVIITHNDKPVIKVSPIDALSKEKIKIADNSDKTCNL